MDYDPFVAEPPNTAWTRTVRVVTSSSSLRGFKLVPSKWCYLVPPTTEEA